MGSRVVRAAIDCVAMCLIVAMSAGLTWIIWQ